MNPKNIAVSTLVLTTCVLMCACTTVDKFTIHDTSNGESTSLQEPPLVLKDPCKYVAGSDISGSLSPGPLQPDAIATPAPSNSHIKEPIYLIQIGDLQVPGVKGGHDIASFIGVRKDGTLLHNILLHSDMPGASPFADENARIKFAPENCHYSIEAVNAQGFISNPRSSSHDIPVIHAGRSARASSVHPRERNN